MSDDFEVSGQNDAAPFTLKVHRGEGMVLLGMNWKNGSPPQDFVGFAIEYQAPGDAQVTAVENRLSFAAADGSANPGSLSTREAPIQGFRWVHFPPDTDVAGQLLYRVTPVFMDAQNQLSYGEPQEATVDLGSETYPGELNVAFTRGFVASQAFVDRYEANGDISLLLPADADAGLDFQPTHPDAAEALAWMGFKARTAILGLLDEALADPDAEVRVVAYDFNLPDVLTRLEKLGSRVKAIIDDSGSHLSPNSAESKAAARLAASAGADNVKRQHMGALQHNKTLVVNGPRAQGVVCGSTNFSWRGWYVQNNNAMVMRGKTAVDAFQAAFDNYWAHSDVSGFDATASATWQDAGLAGIDARVTFSPHSTANAALPHIADDMMQNITSSLFYSLAFLYQTHGRILDAINAATNNADLFVYGISDHPVKGIVLLKPDGNEAPVSPAALSGNVPEPFKSEPTGGSGVRLHHKFVVIDFDKPTARVYMGSHNFSNPADNANGENLVCVRDRRVATSYMIEAVRICDHYRFRDIKQTAKELVLATPPRNPGEQPWWAPHFSQPEMIRARELFS
ncbi:MAG TPA: phospholipase D-like domain-containing protein [Longimicrobium sp.]|nr:phospholipase D-like domain-containing protein [Longimicrobium sp.]